MTTLGRWANAIACASYRQLKWFTSGFALRCIGSMSHEVGSQVNKLEVESGGEIPGAVT